MQAVTVYTTRPDTLYGATFFVVAADAALAEELVSPEQRTAFEAYREQVRKLSDIERQSTEREKTGVFLGVHAVNPVNGEKLPVYAADYVLADYGTGAIMAVPAHDQRDLDFARAFDLPVRVVVDTGGEDPAVTGVATAGDGMLINSGTINGLPKAEAIERITAELAGRGLGEPAVNYRLRDWLLSRQRYWGCPIPVVHCEKDGIVAVPDDQLPVLLPELSGEQLAPKGESPLASAHDWVRDDVPDLRRAGQPGHRHDGHLRRFVLVLLPLLLAGLRRRAVRPRGGPAVDAGRAVRRRRRARDPAPAVFAVLHQGPVRPRAWSISSSRSAHCSTRAVS